MRCSFDGRMGETTLEVRIYFYVVEEREMKKIALTQGQFSIVDDEDFEAFGADNWYSKRIRKSSCMFYAERGVHRPGGRRTHEKMHRVVLSRKLGRDLDKSEQCDHINGDGLDNQRENLRLATHSQNQRNCRRHVANPSSQFLGVSWHKASGKWRADVQVDGKQVYLGLHATELAAALAREAFIVAYPELHARSNFLTEKVAT